MVVLTVSLRVVDGRRVVVICEDIKVGARVRLAVQLVVDLVVRVGCKVLLIVLILEWPWAR